MPAKFIIRQSTLSALLLVIFLFIALLLGGSVIYMNISIQDEQTAEKRRTEFKQLGINLAAASDYLTDEARKYAVTTDAIHMYKYWEEINQTKTRDYVIARLGELDSPNAEMELLAEAKKNSDALVETEKESMRLVLEAQGAAESEMPPAVAHFQLTAEDKKLNAAEKLARARDIMFDNKYDLDKQSIMQPIAQFQDIMNARLEAELSAARDRTEKAALLQVVLAVIIIGAVAALLRLFFTQVNRPIQNYNEVLTGFSLDDEHFRLVPDGSRELRLLADTFNNLFTSMKAAKEEAEQANKAKSEFLAHMSHEIRTPLHTVIGYNYLLGSTTLTPKQQEYSGNISKAATGLLAIISEILDFSKIEAQRMTLEAVEFDLYDTVEELCSMVEVEARQKGLMFNREIQSAVPRYVKGDMVKLKQVILNLLANSVKFTQQGSIGIFLELIENEGEHIVLGVSVTDTGIGISPEQQQRLFNAFTQGDASTSRKYGGTGLGLAIARKMVELMSGSITVHSAVGQGSCFSFAVPLAAVAQLSCHRTAAAGNKKIMIEKRILLVEDNLINLQMTKEILETFGFTVDTAPSGRMALAWLGQATYDAILLDIRMPEMDGYETARRIIAATGEKCPPLVALSADAVQGVEEQARQAGFSGYLTKPLEVARLIEVLQTHLALPPASGSGAATAGEQSNNAACLDAASAVARLGGKKAAYKQLLKRFVGHGGDADTLATQIATGDFAGAKLLVHTLKGTAANIGATRLTQVCCQVEQALSQENDQALRLATENLAIVLAETCLGAIEYATAITEPAANTMPAGQGTDLDDILDKIAQLLEAGDAEACSLFAQSQAILQTGMGSDAYWQIYKTIQAYDFAEAYNQLKAIRGHQ
ncbi:ATP-binding protein [Sporomusa termitida]|uniref:Circadian input-output histidine kinase CikA n=1 Tax=Sporomusa termitida TaxID=2377 RepID=A0A517DWL9_9FIRM|nr:ATP-binding protein [Sporomusa termitida]QDR81742.1 Sensor histidine kinase RcsC [Sporomusa termitida]